MGQVRSFFAVRIEQEVAARIAQAQAGLKQSEASVKWVAPANFHFTLKFLGGVEDGAIPALIAAAARELAGAASFPLRAAGLGAFPGLTRPRVIWAGITEGREALVALAERIERACEEQGFPREQRPFSTHLTLGRVREGGELGDLPERLREASELEFGETAVDRVVLMESRLHPEGPEYLVQAEFELKGEAG